MYRARKRVDERVRLDAANEIRMQGETKMDRGKLDSAIRYRSRGAPTIVNLSSSEADNFKKAQQKKATEAYNELEKVTQKAITKAMEMKKSKILPRQQYDDLLGRARNLYLTAKTMFELYPSGRGIPRNLREDIEDDILEFDAEKERLQDLERNAPRRNVKNSEYEAPSAYKNARFQAAVNRSINMIRRRGLDIEENAVPIAVDHVNAQIEEIIQDEQEAAHENRPDVPGNLQYVPLDPELIREAMNNWGGPIPAAAAVVNEPQAPVQAADIAAEVEAPAAALDNVAPPAVNGDHDREGANNVGQGFGGTVITRSFGDSHNIVTNAVKQRLARCPADRQWWDTNDNLAFVGENVEENMLEILKNGELTEKEKARNEAGVAAVLHDFPQYRMYTSNGSNNLLSRPSSSKRMRTM